MKLLRAATLSVGELESTVGRYAEWLDYSVAERGTLDPALAAAWGAPASAGAAYAVMRPASGKNVYLRFVENRVHPDYVPLRTYGWAAIEICVEDVLAVNERMLGSPFEIIGPPREIDGLPAIYPMQVRGPDNEIAYFTQIRDDLPAFDLPRAAAPIDRLFILVMACSDMAASLDWMAEHVGIEIGRERMEIVYTMLANAFGTPLDELHAISTMVHERDVFLELDQMPPQATPRPRHDNALPQGIALGSFWHPDFDALAERNADLWIAPPAAYDSVIYDGAQAATLRTPDGTLVEIVAEPVRL